MADEVQATFFGTAGTQRIQSALKRILAKVQRKNFNCLEVTASVGQDVFGIPFLYETGPGPIEDVGYWIVADEGLRTGSQTPSHL